MKYGDSPALSGVNMCFNAYCIYQKGAYCQLPGISLNEQGVCSECKMLKPDQDAAVLQYRKDHDKGK